MNNTADIIRLTQETTSGLLETLDLFSQEQLNMVPFEGSWTGGQTAEHLLKSRSGLVDILSYNTAPAERAPDEKVQPLKEMFLNFEVKFQAPNELAPTNPGHDKDDLYKELGQNGQALDGAIAEMNFDLLCKAFPFPVFGYLTRLEWLYFTAFHTQRHTRQMKNILEKLRE